MSKLTKFMRIFKRIKNCNYDLSESLSSKCKRIENVIVVVFSRKSIKISILREFDDTLRDLNDDINSNLDKQNKCFSN